MNEDMFNDPEAVGKAFADDLLARMKPRIEQAFAEAFKDKMIPKKFVEAMQKLIDKYGDDPEDMHKAADDLMESVLIDLGYGEGVELYHNSDLLIFYS